MILTGDELETIDNDGLIKIIENLIEENKLLRVENKLNERFLSKNDPELLHGITATLETAKRKPKIKFAQSVQEIHSETDKITDLQIPSEHSLKSDFSRKASTYSTFSRATSTASSNIFRGRQQAKLSFVVKSEICDAECKLEHRKLNEFKKKMRVKFSELLAEIEEIKLTTQDVNHAVVIFNDFVIFKGMRAYRCKFLDPKIDEASQGVNPITKKLPLERFQKFIRNYIRSGATVVEKMRLKSFTLESNHTEKKLELQQRTEMSSILRPVDFEQLKIDIKTLGNSLKEKTANMMGLKNLNGNITLLLVDERRQLASIEVRLKNYREKCKTYRHETQQMCEKIEKIESDMKYWTNLVDELHEKIKSFSAPSFDDYFQLKIRLREFEKEEKRLKRKRNISIIKWKNTRHKYEMTMNAKCTETD